MKFAKKCVWAVIALLPVAVFLSYVVGNFGSEGGVSFVPLGDITISTTAEGLREVVVTPDSWGDYILTPLYGSEPVGGFFGAVAGLVDFLDTHAGIHASVPLLSALLLFAYLAVVELLVMVIDFVMFVPRKCSELFM